MIITRTPLRISFAGGGTDFPNFFGSDYGFVVASTINKYVTVIVTERFDDQLYVNYSKKEIVADVDEVQHGLVREALCHTGLRTGLEITMLADVPSEGSGLGSSSALTVGLLHALSTHAGCPYDPARLAKAACDIEVCELAQPIGYQDQYITAYGGLKALRFSYLNGGHQVIDLGLSGERRAALSRELLLFFTGKTRQSGTVLAEQDQRTETNRERLILMRTQAHTLARRLVQGEPLALGPLLDAGWQLKRGLASGITNQELDDQYASARAAGATGGKIAGAGGGGFLLLHVPLARQEAVRAALRPLVELPFALCRYGSQIIFNDQE